MCHMIDTIPESAIQNKACTVTKDFYKLVSSKMLASVIRFLDYFLFLAWFNQASTGVTMPTPFGSNVGFLNILD